MSTSLLDTAKWELLHQEGMILLEQINRKLTPPQSLPSLNNNPTNDNNSLQPPSPQQQQPQIIDISYLERSIQRLDNINNEYLTQLEQFSFEVQSFKTKCLGKYHNHVTTLTNRGELNIDYSPIDIVIAYDGLFQMLYQECTQKGDILVLFQTLLHHHLSNSLQSHATCLPNQINNNNNQNNHNSQNATQPSSSLSASYTTSLPPDLLEQWPWVQQSLQFTPATSSSSTSSTSAFDQIISHEQLILRQLQHTDITGIVALFSQRPGFDLPQYNRLVAIIKSAPAELKSIVDTVSVVSTIK